MDDLLYTRTVMGGGCTPLTNALPLVITQHNSDFSVVRQFFPNGQFSNPSVVWNHDLIGYDGRAPHDIVVRHDNQ